MADRESNPVLYYRKKFRKSKGLVTWLNSNGVHILQELLELELFSIRKLKVLLC